MAKKFIVFILILFVLGGLSFFVFKNKLESKATTDQRQAVFMTNGQVYFGNIDTIDENYINLNDVYYLKGSDLAKLTDNSDDKKKILLVKMGNELHQPQNSMHINRDQVLFFQDLTLNSRINEAISKFASNQVQ